MTSLIENQRVSRRSTAVRPGHVPHFRFPVPNILTPALAYAVVGILVIAVVSVLVGAVSLEHASRFEISSLPFDGSADQLLSDYVTDAAASKHDQGDSVPPSGELPAGIEPISYTVARGDTVSEIAAHFDLRIDTIISYNRIEDVRSVRAGSVLLIPAFDSGKTVDGVLYTVRRGDSLSGIVSRFSVDLNPVLDANQLSSAVIQPGQVLFIPQARMDTVALRRALGTLFIRPIPGRLTSEFGMRIDPFTGLNSMHYGVDLANVIGTPVHASNDGVVSMVGQSRTLGNYIIIDHVEQYQTLYAHLSAWSVREGMRVRQGAVIGKVGNTGKSTGPHLHFAIYKNYEPVDPLDYVH